jgi:hypothetical protein
MSIRLREDVEFMMNSDSWPMYPYLPLKKPSMKAGEWPQLGIMHASGSRVYLTSIDELVSMSFAEKSNIKYIDYDSYDAIVEDGWLVD